MNNQDGKVKRYSSKCGNPLNFCFWPVDISR